MHGKIMGRCIAALAALLVTTPTLAVAHPGGQIHDLWHGFAHPLTGLDHLIAMLAIGVFAAQLGGRARWLVPVTFIVVMALATAAGMLALTIPHVETGIALSVLLLGAAIAFSVNVSLPLAMSIAGLFAVFHGYAHGAEMPAAASGVLFGLGLIVATALLNTVGVAFGLLIGQATGGRQIAQLAGGAAVVVGAVLLVIG
jgi:urease accessory protein